MSLSKIPPEYPRAVYLKCVHPSVARNSLGRGDRNSDCVAPKSSEPVHLIESLVVLFIVIEFHEPESLA